MTGALGGGENVTALRFHGQNLRSSCDLLQGLELLPMLNIEHVGRSVFRVEEAAYEPGRAVHQYHAKVWPVIQVSVRRRASESVLTLFRWHHIPENEEWRCVLYGRLLSLKQDSSHLYYRAFQRPPLPTPPASHLPSTAESDSDCKTELLEDKHDENLLRIIKHYLNLSSNLTDLYSQWSSQDPNFKKKAAQFTGIRILRQDAWEALVSFICSSNNNIARISQMVEKLCINYGPFVATIGGRAYHDFPAPEALAGKNVEGNLRSLGFGYRAKYIYQTALMVSQDREPGWLDGLCNPESPALGVEARTGDEMKPEGRPGYRDAHEKLLQLQGVGPKVADCVCLMGLGWGESVPVDTHGEFVQQISTSSN